MATAPKVEVRIRRMWLFRAALSAMDWLCTVRVLSPDRGATMLNRLIRHLDVQVRIDGRWRSLGPRRNWWPVRPNIEVEALSRRRKET